MATHWLEINSSGFESRTLSINTTREEATPLCIPWTQISTSLTTDNGQGTKRFPIDKSQTFSTILLTLHSTHSFLLWFYDKVGVKHSIEFRCLMKGFSSADFIKIYINTFAILKDLKLLKAT